MKYHQVNKLASSISGGRQERSLQWSFLYDFSFFVFCFLLGGGVGKITALTWSSQVAQCQCRRLRFNSWVRKIPWRRKWQPAPVFLPRESHGQRSQAGYSPWCLKESDTTEVKHSLCKYVNIMLIFKLRDTVY